MTDQKFDVRGFDWKKAIWEMRGELTTLSEQVANHLQHHEKWNKWLMAIAAAVIGGSLVWIFRSYFFLTK